jgi:hypothetical protein
MGDRMNLAAISKRVQDMTPGIEAVRIEATKNNDGIYFLCKKDGKGRCVFVQRFTAVMMFGIRTDEQIACEIAKELRE